MIRERSRTLERDLVEHDLRLRSNREGALWIQGDPRLLRAQEFAIIVRVPGSHREELLHFARNELDGTRRDIARVTRPFNGTPRGGRHDPIVSRGLRPLGYTPRSHRHQRAEYNRAQERAVHLILD